MKKKIIFTSLVMASVLPFLGGIETVRADEVKNLDEKAKSDLDQAKESLKTAQDEKAKLEEDLGQAKKDGEEKAEEKEALNNKLKKAEENIKENQKILDKEGELKKVDKEIENLGQKMKAAENEADLAKEKYDQAKKAFENAQNKSEDKKFVKEDEGEALKKQYEVADDLLTQNKKTEAQLQNGLKEKIEKQNELTNKKDGIKDFFDSYEKDKSNAEKIKSQDYQDFKKNQEKTYEKIDNELKNLKGEVNGYNNSLKSIGDNIKNEQKVRDEKFKAYEKHKQALNIQKDYEEKNIGNLDDFDEQKRAEIEEAAKKLGDAKKKTEEGLADYQHLLLQETEKKRVIAKAKAAAKFLEEKLTEKTDAFVRANEDFIAKEKATYDDIAKEAENLLKLVQDDLGKKAAELDKLYKEQSNEQEDYEKKQNSLEIARELKQFIENKKSSNQEDQLTKELENKMNEAKDFLDKKLAIIEDLAEKDKELKAKKDKLGDIDLADLEKAKAQIEKDKQEIEKINEQIKELDESAELSKVKKIEDEIRKLEQRIKEIKGKIQDLENPKVSKQTNNYTHGEDTDRSEESVIDLLRTEFDRIYDNINQKNSYEEFKTALIRSNKTLSIARVYLEKLSSLKLEKIGANSYQKLRFEINRIKKIIALAEFLQKNHNMGEKEKIELVKLIKELKTNISLIEKNLNELGSNL